MLFYLQIQEWLCLNCQTQRAISGQLGDLGKMPPTQLGPKASPLPVPTEQPSQKTATAAQANVKKKEQEVKSDAEKVIPEKVKEIPSIEKITPKVTTDQKQEEGKPEKDKTSAPQEKKSLPEDKKPPPGAKTSALEEDQKHVLPQTEVQILEEKPEARVAAQAGQEEKRPQTETEDKPCAAAQSRPQKGDSTTPKIKEPQAASRAKPDGGEPGKEKTVSYVFLTLQSFLCK